MNIEVKNTLRKEYNNLSYKTKITAIKYSYVYNKVGVNVYFDEYDKENPSLSMILNFEKNYYYTSLNVKNTNIRKEYLEKIPICILKQILNNDNKLDDFFYSIEEHILKGKYVTINYKKDIFFTNTMQYSKRRFDLPFLSAIRKTRMSNDALERLHETMGIDREILFKIQSANMTLVRTSEPEKRKTLIALLDGTAIRL